MKIKSIVITSELGYFARNTRLFDRVREQKVTIEEFGNVKINSVTFRDKTKESNFVISEEDIGKLFRKFEEAFEQYKETLQLLDAGIWTVCIETESTRKEYRGSVHEDCFNELSTTLRGILGEWNLIAFDGKTKDIEAVGDEYTYYFVWIERVGRVYSYLANEEYEIGDWVEVPFGYEDKVVKGRIDDIEVCTKEEAPWPPEETKYIIGPTQSMYSEDELEEKLKWSCEHHENTDSIHTMKKVIEGYKTCVENEYKLYVSALNLGAIYYAGIRVKRDFKEAVRLYKIAAKHGSVIAISNLGYCYYHGRFVEKDYKKAYEYFNKGSLLKDKTCLYKLGDMYLNGYYVEKDEEFAYELYKRARDEMDFEDMEDDGDIYLRLGRAKLKGQGTERDLDEAMEYLCLAYPMIWKNRKRNPFSKDVAEYCKELIEECEEAMEEEWVELY